MKLQVVNRDRLPSLLDNGRPFRSLYLILSATLQVVVGQLSVALSRIYRSLNAC